MMWKDRLSGYSTPATSSQAPSRPRSQSPAPSAARKASHLAPLVGINSRPAFSARSSSLSLISNVSISASSSARVGHDGPRNHLESTGDARDTLSNAEQHQVDVTKVLETLESILSSIPRDTTEKRSHENEIRGIDGNVAEPQQSSSFALIQAASIDFRGKSLQEFVQIKEEERKDLDHDNGGRSSHDYDEVEREKLEDLHHSIAACDDVLASVEQYLSNFQTDLGVVSTEIEKLQARSTKLNLRLKNRQDVERLLGPAVEEFSISPVTIQKICEGIVDESWVVELVEVERRFEMMQNVKEDGTSTSNTMKALEDLRPLFTDLINKAIERIRDYLVAQIKALRSPNVNAQIVQQKAFIRFKDLYRFLVSHHQKLAEEIGQAYVYTMRWYYLNHFTRYSQSLEKLKIHIMDKTDLIGHTGDVSRKSSPNQTASSSSSTTSTRDALNIHTRHQLLQPSPNNNNHNIQNAISSHLAEETSTPCYLETPFYHFNLALHDNASTEYIFLNEFFSSLPYQSITRSFHSIFDPTFQLGQRITKTLIENNLDALGILLTIRLNSLFAFELQRRKIPTVESYMNATNMLLWPKFQMVMDSHCDSLKKATGGLSTGGSSRAMSLIGGGAGAGGGGTQSGAPHIMTQRFGWLFQGLLMLSKDAGDDDGPTRSGLRRLRNEYEGFVMKFGKSIADARRRQRWLGNNYALVLTIISDTTGKLADEQKEHFENLKLGLEQS